MRITELNWENVREFSEWAFNDRSGCQSLRCDLAEWNRKHGDLLPLESVSHLFCVMDKLVEMWVESRYHDVKKDVIADDINISTDKNGVAECQRTLDDSISTE